MQQHKFSTLTIGAMVILAMLLTGCGKGTDVVTGHLPVSAALAQVREAIVPLPPAKRAAYMQQHFPDLGQQLVWFLREHNTLPNGATVQNVEFFAGSLEKVKAEDGNGVTNEGFFENQLVARVHIVGQQKPVDVIVSCLNGAFNLPGNLVQAGMTPLGTQTPVERFTIANGEGIVPHVGYITAVELARKHHIMLYRGKKQDPVHIISYDEALKADTDQTQITAGVKPGDKFDLIAGAYTPAPKAAPRKHLRAPVGKRAKVKRISFRR